MFKPIQTTVSALLDLVYPPVCLVCGVDNEAGALCEACSGAFKPIGPPFCDRCGEPISGGRQIVCRRCEQGSPPAYSWSQAPYQYDGALLRSIQRLKYDGKTSLAAPLGGLLARSLNSESHLFDEKRDPTLSAFDVVVPVPLHTARLRRRGFNQAELIGSVVAEHLRIPLAAKAIRRIKSTPTQTAMTLEMRAANIRGAFRVVCSDAIEGKAVLIVDDVLTSTSTARELARVIAEAGCSRVCVVAVARSV